MTRLEYVELLQQKTILLARITENTERQIRFIRRQAMVGWRRLLREREGLLEKLSVVVALQQASRQWCEEEEVQEIHRQISQMEEQLLIFNASAMQSAAEGKARIAEKMRGNTQAKDVRKIYIHRWYQGISRGFSRKA